ncbi:MAG: type III-B CRISPR module RAMP protein Cmr4 [Bryobacteraceae bacterium]|nr:type III-B CRISPR module RAMP protein Cmr4 [Bryobacteraceae bacterium]MDW8379095.1 type III-B CRISPR module RAMP protein Cmr4 [Bryobacterales bacterium]
MAVDPIHVGTGGGRLGRVDQSIVRDPVTRVPKIPGSSLAGVYRAYAAMAKQKYPDCAGQGQPNKQGKGGHCGKPDCPICTVFGFARSAGGGFAGLAAFSDAQVLFFPVATREGPVWISCPGAMRLAEADIDELTDAAVYRSKGGQSLNLGWLMLPVKQFPQPNDGLKRLESTVPAYLSERIALVSDKLFSHIVNSNLEVRTSVSINPETGAAEEGALFTYEALPRSTVLLWEVISKNPTHFKVGDAAVSAVKDMNDVSKVVEAAHSYLECLGVGGMGTRGMGRLRVLSFKAIPQQPAAPQEQTGGA